MRILWVKTGPLLPLDTGGKRRTHALLTEMSKIHHVVYASLLPEGEELHAQEESNAYAAEKIWIRTHTPAKGSLGFWLDLAKSTIFTTRPYALQRYETKALKLKLCEFSKENEFDLVICDFLAPALNFVGLKFRCPVILFQHNIEAQIWRRLAENQTSPVKRWYLGIQHRRMKHWEVRLSTLFDGVITVSPEDTEISRTEYRLTNVLGHVPTGVDVDSFQPAAPSAQGQPFVMGFLGSMDWMPNIDATLDFVKEVLPRVRATLPDCRFKIIGRKPPAKIRELAANDPGIEVTGTVEEVQSHVHECDVIVVPLKAGGGTRIKIYEAMAMGVPVVSTTIGAEGLAVTHGVDILIADDAAAFAAALLNLAQDRNISMKLAQKARSAVEANHSWTKATRCFMDLTIRCKPASS